LNGADLIDAWLPANEEDLEELRDMAVRILASTEEPARILEELRYQITQPDLPESPDSVRVMSLHKSKGLTARLVVIAGCIQGVIPHLDDDASQADRQRQLEEQRRLFYVAITRTSEVLILSAPLLIDFSTASRIHALARGRRGGNILAVFTSFRDELGPQAPEVQRGADFLARFVVPAVIRRP